MPFPIRLLTYIIPAKYFVQCLQTLFLVGNIYPLIFFNLIPILALGALFFLITSCHTKKWLD
jgi:ABC-2 type transport system permease protein